MLKKQFKNILLLNSSEVELFQQKRIMDMFGIAGHIHTETSGIAALHYLRNIVQLPELVIASLGKGEKKISAFILGFEELIKCKGMNQSANKSNVVLLYDEEQNEFKRFKNYRQLKKPLCVPELCDTHEWWETILN